MTNQFAAPKELTDEAKAKWAELTPLFAGRGDVNEFTRDLLRSYCEAFAMRAEAIRRLNIEGRMLEQGPNGARYPSPWLKVIDQAEKTMDRVWRRLKLEGDAIKASDGWDEFDKFCQARQ